MNTVKKLAIFGIVLIGAVSISADDHQAASMVHINLCYFNDGKEIRKPATILGYVEGVKKLRSLNLLLVTIGRGNRIAGRKVIGIYRDFMLFEIAWRACLPPI